MKIVFIINILRQARCLRRVEDFMNNGYSVIATGFDREGDNRALPSFQHKIIGHISRTTSYFKRLLMMKNAIKEEQTKHDKDVVYYIFSLDVAIAFLLAGGLRKRYMYEVSDLMELEVGNRVVSVVLTWINKFIIRRSIETIVTSPGFEDYLFPNQKLKNISIVANKLNKKIIEQPKHRDKTFDINNLTIGFTGAIRNAAIYNFIEVVGESFPNIKLRFHGIFTDDKVYSVKIQNAIAKYDNISYHGPFKNPYDFPEIYSNIDMVLCLYTAKGNDKVLEPNKLYEAIYFEKPIIVSKGTFTGAYVEERHIGYTVNGEDKESIKLFLQSLTMQGYIERKNNCAKIPKTDLIDNTTHLFEKLESILK